MEKDGRKEGKRMVQGKSVRERRERTAELRLKGVDLS